MHINLSALLYVAMGGGIGSLLRYLCSLGLQGFSLSFPYGTLLANLAGCFLIGGVTQLAAGTEVLSPASRLFLATGVCGGFTTLSSFIFELTQLLRDGEAFIGALYFGVTLIGAILSFYAGVLLLSLVVR